MDIPLIPFYDQKAQEKSLKWLVHMQNKDGGYGAWEARWGVNYLYATGAVVAALSKTRVDRKDPLLGNAIDWILSVQNKDGGWGEGFDSYTDIKMPVSESAPTRKLPGRFWDCLPPVCTTIPPSKRASPFWWKNLKKR